MTTEILTEKKVQPQINWDKPQWLISEDQVVLSNGKHKDALFEGLVLPCSWHEEGEFSRSWSKSQFKPIPTEGLVIKIKND